MSQIATQHIVIAGTKPTYGAAANGDTAKVGPGFFLICKNAAGSPITLTLAVPGTLENNVAAPDTTFTVAATTGEVWVPLDAYYADPSDGLCHITYSAITTVTVAVVKR